MFWDRAKGCNIQSGHQTSKYDIVATFSNGQKMMIFNDFSNFSPNSKVLFWISKHMSPWFQKSKKIPLHIFKFVPCIPNHLQIVSNVLGSIVFDNQNIILDFEESLKNLRKPSFSGYVGLNVLWMARLTIIDGFLITTWDVKTVFWIPNCFLIASYISFDSIW